MIPGEIFPKSGDIELNVGASTVTLTVANTGDRPVQVGSHYHFYETNPGLVFDRDKTRGMRLDIAAGTAVRFEPGQKRDVTLVPLSGGRTPAVAASPVAFRKCQDQVQAASSQACETGTNTVSLVSTSAAGARKATSRRTSASG